jgi:hypothetical protein
MSGDAADLRRQLYSLVRELERMGLHLEGSEWHQDRQEELAWLRRTIARLESARRGRE